MLMAAATGLGAALLLFAVLGAGETFLMLAATVTIQRQSPTDVLSRVFGIVEGCQMAAIAIGGLLVTIMVTRLTVTESFVALGVVVFGLVGVGVWRLHGTGAAPLRSTTPSSTRSSPIRCSLPCRHPRWSDSVARSPTAECQLARRSSSRATRVTTTT